MYWSNTIILSPQTLLDDPHPTVRCNAILGVCKILAKCWELLPPTIITDFLKKLVMELAADSSSPDVRCSVFKVEDALSLFTFSWNSVQTVWSPFELYRMKTESVATTGRRLDVYWLVVCVMLFLVSGYRPGQCPQPSSTGKTPPYSQIQSTWQLWEGPHSFPGHAHQGEGSASCQGTSICFTHWNINYLWHCPVLLWQLLKSVCLH